MIGSFAYNLRYINCLVIWQNVYNYADLMTPAICLNSRQAAHRVQGYGKPKPLRLEKNGEAMKSFPVVKQTNHTISLNKIPSAEMEYFHFYLAWDNSAARGNQELLFGQSARQIVRFEKADRVRISPDNSAGCVLIRTTSSPRAYSGGWRKPA